MSNDFSKVRFIRCTFGMSFCVLAMMVCLSPTSSPGTTRSTLTSHASYSPAFFIASVKSSSLAPPLLVEWSPDPLPSLPVILSSFSLVARSTLPILSFVFFATCNKFGTTRDERAGTPERALRISSDLRTLLKEAPLRRRPLAGFEDVAAWRREFRTELSPA